MSYTAWPTSSDLQQWLVSAGLMESPPSTEQELMLLNAHVLGARQEFERRTGYEPFLAVADPLPPDPSTATTRYYDPPGPHVRRGYGNYSEVGGGRILQLDNGLIDCTSITAGMSDVWQGSLLVVNTDYWLKPTNAAAAGRPYEWIEFRSPRWGTGRSIVVTGHFGYGYTIPDDAWLAVLMRAGLIGLPSIAAVTSGGATAVRLGEDSWQFGGGGASGGAFAPQAAAWQQQYEAIVQRYRRVVL